MDQMALTFTEARNQVIQGPGDSNLVVATLVITQDDSRTAWGGEGELLLKAATGSLSNIGGTAKQFVMRFSDRGPSPFAGNSDQIELELAQLSSNLFEATILLKSWGATYKIRLSSQPRGIKAKMLTGWGNAMGGTADS